MSPSRPTLPANPIAVALDVADIADAEGLARALAGHVGLFKVGLELFSAYGPQVVQRIAAHGPVFLDLKLHDIPTTVRRSAQVLGGLGVAMVTVHAAGGAAMVSAAVDGLGRGASEAGHDEPLVLAVTVLTSMSDEELSALNSPRAALQVPTLARLAVDAGAPGLVCAPQDLTRVREAVGHQPVLVTPGVRPSGAPVDDHARATTPAEAVRAGADLLVVGRPITRADDPVAVARDITAELGVSP